MYADVERVRFDAAQHFLRVVQQQGRVVMAAETNEQVAILLHHIQALAADLIGPGGTSMTLDATGKLQPDAGFAVTMNADGTDFAVEPGHYWVRGRLCELEPPEPGAAATSYLRQPDFTPPALPTAGTHLVYLDVWERHVGAAEDPGLVEVALGGPDSCSRTKLVWQVKVVAEVAQATPNSIRNRWPDIERRLGRLEDGGRLTAEVNRTRRDPTPCLAAPASGYTAGENQLIHVEIHRGGPLADKPTVKWAWDNASVAHRVRRVDGRTVVLAQPPRDVRKGFAQGTRVELLSDEQVRNGPAIGTAPGLLTTVTGVNEDADDYELTLAAAAPFSIDEDDRDSQGRPRWAVLRRWDHAGADLVDGARPLAENTVLPLGGGVQITFAAPAAGEPAWTYRPGDHWTIPVRVATGDVIWPRDADGNPVPQPPEGIEHRYAPLAVFAVGSPMQDARTFIKPVTAP